VAYRFYTADVFTDHPFGGNQLAVFPDARGLHTEQMQRITREFNLSETVFVFPPQNPQNSRRLRIFTPGAELPFAGHPTIGTAHILAAIGEIALKGDTTEVIFEEGVGPVQVTIRATAGQPIFAQLQATQLPQAGPPPPSIAQIAQILSLDESDILSGDHGPLALSCGVPFLFVPVQSRVAIASIRLNQTHWEQTMASFWAPHLYVFTTQTVQPGAHLHARMFAPAMGIAEDPATGAAAAALPAYLLRHHSQPTGTKRWLVEQGVEMGRPSLIEIEADTQNGALTAVRVGGASILMSEGRLIAV
jgi:trans-2,3-dihydro-3-hydroxyanthranilate isomerase